MAHLFQVGAGSGGMPVLDMVCRDPRITRLTLVEPDVYKPHNVERHLFPAVGSRPSPRRSSWPSEWLRKQRRPDLEGVQTLLCDVLQTRRSRPRSTRRSATARHRRLCGGQRAGQVSLGCPYATPWQALDLGRGTERRHWRVRALVRAGGSLLWLRCQPPAALGGRSTNLSPTPDYSQPGGAAAETTIPASKASIQAIASLHALVTLGLLAAGRPGRPTTARLSPACCSPCSGCRTCSTRRFDLFASA